MTNLELFGNDSTSYKLIKMKYEKKIDISAQISLEMSIRVKKCVNSGIKSPGWPHFPGQIPGSEIGPIRPTFEMQAPYL